MKLLEALSCVDLVVRFSELTPFKVIKAIMPDVLIKGDDYKKEDIIGADLVLQNGGEVKTFELLKEGQRQIFLQRKKHLNLKN